MTNQRQAPDAALASIATPPASETSTSDKSSCVTPERADVTKADGLVETERAYGMALASTTGDAAWECVMRDAAASVLRLCGHIEHLTARLATLEQGEHPGFMPCPTCKQYSHSLGGDAAAKAYMHFHSMFSHRGDGIPTQYSFDEVTRHAAKVLMAQAGTFADGWNQCREAAVGMIGTDFDAPHIIDAGRKIATAILALTPTEQQGR